MSIDQITHMKTDSLTGSQHLGRLFHLRPGGFYDQTNDIDLRHRFFEQRKIIEYLFGHIGLQWCRKNSSTNDVSGQVAHRQIQ